MRIKNFLILLLLVPSGIIYSQKSDFANRFRLAQSYEQAGDIQKAGSLYESLYKEDALNYQLFESLNRCYIQLKKFDESVNIISARIKLMPQDFNLYGLLGSSYYQKGEESKAYQVWDDAVSRSESNNLVFRIIANYAIERRAFEKAIFYLSEGKKRSNEYFAFSFDLAHLHSMLMHYREATDEYCYILSKQSSNLEIVQSRMSAYITKPEAKTAAEEVTGLWYKKTGDLNFLLLSGWINMENKDFRSAYNIYIEIDKMRNNKGADIFSYAQSAYKDGFYDEASAAFEKILTDYPDSPFAPGARIGYAKTLEASLDIKYESALGSWKPYFKVTGKEEYEKVVAAYNDILNTKNIGAAADEVYFRMANVKARKLSRPDEAIADLEKMREKFPISLYTVQAYSLFADIYISKNDLTKAEEYCGKIDKNTRSLASDKLNSALMRGKLRFFSGNFTESLNILDEITNTAEDNSANDAIELSLIINTSRQDSLSLLNFAQAELFTLQYKFSEAAEIYKKLSLNNNLLTLKDLSEFRYAQMLIALDELPTGIEVLEKIINKEDSGIYGDKACYLLASVYENGIKDAAKAREYYEKLLINFPNSFYLDSARKRIQYLKSIK